jgi:predicted AAA+ superfamily ATPase
MDADYIEYKRSLHLTELLDRSSYFLLGPRGTGKSFLIRQQLADRALVINLLHNETRLRLLTDPSELNQMIAISNKKIVVIDEIQKVPELLDEVHHLIEEKKIRFLLTGSSARRIKKANANLLAGRAYNMNFHPLNTHEVKNFNLTKYLLYGGLPNAYRETKPSLYLSAYCNKYLEEEIQAEALTRNLAGFSRFLKTAALSSGQLINFTKLGRDAQVRPSTVRSYYEILKDTLIGKTLESWRDSKNRKAIETGKFYFFDIGVANYLSGFKALPENSDIFGRAFEHFLFQEIQCYLDYTEADEFFGFWRDVHGHEVDFLIGDEVAIEVKATKKVDAHDTKNLKILMDEKKFKNYYLITQDPIEKKMGAIQCLNWKTFCSRLWGGEII